MEITWGGVVVVVVGRGGFLHTNTHAAHTHTMMIRHSNDTNIQQSTYTHERRRRTHIH